MAILNIPLRPDVIDYNFRIALDGSTFLFAVRYNQRADIWHLDITDSAGTLLKAGIPALNGSDLLLGIDPDKKPQGILFTFNPEDENVDAGAGDLGDSVFLLYDEAT